MHGFRLVIVELERTAQSFERMADRQADQGTRRIETLTAGRQSRQLAGVARAVVDMEREHVEFPVRVELVAHAAEEVPETTVGRRAMTVGLREALGEAVIDGPLASRQVELLGEGREASGRELDTAADAFGGPGRLRNEVDGPESIAELGRLRALEDVDPAHAVDRQKVEERMVPDPHIEGQPVDVGLDFRAGAAAAHPADIDCATFLTTVGTYGIEAGDRHAGRATQRRRDVERIEVTDLARRDRGGEVAETVDDVAIDDRRGRHDDRSERRRRRSRDLRQRIGGEGRDAERERGEEERTSERSFHEDRRMIGFRVPHPPPRGWTGSDGTEGTPVWARLCYEGKPRPDLTSGDRLRPWLWAEAPALRRSAPDSRPRR